MYSHENTQTSDVMAPSHASRNSTLTDFEFDDDALLSPRPSNNQYSNSYGRFRAQNNYKQADDELDYAIDTSALHTALPDFSDGRSGGEYDQEEEEEEEDDDEISIEIGRGRKTDYRLDDSRDSLLSLDDSRLTASIMDGRDDPHQNTAAAATNSALRNISNRSAQRKGDTLRKDAQIRRASLVAQKDSMDPKVAKTRATSGGAQHTQRQQRRTLADMHAKVSEVYDGSYLSDERPPRAHVTARNTRFGNAKSSDQEKIARAVRRAAKGYVEEGVEYAAKRQYRNNNTESFLLPDVENLSELVSGIYQDGIPMNDRQTRPRATRFTSPPAVEIPEEYSEQHARFNAVPIPDDEKAIFNSLRLLQKKVSALEKDNADVEGKMGELRQENTILRAEQLRRQRRVSGGDEEVARGGAATLAVERNRLEAANLALREQLETANRKLSDHESSVQRVKDERNSVVNQLGTVYLGCQGLKSENGALQEENDELKVQLAIMISGKRTAEKKAQQDADSHPQEHMRMKRGVREAPAEADDDTRHSNHKHHKHVGKVTAAQDMPTLDERARELLNKTKDDNYDALFSLGLPSRRATEPKEPGILKKQSKSAEKKPNTSKHRSKRAVIDMEDGTEFETTMDTREMQTRTVTQDLTYLSFVDSREIAQLRKTLEEERIARKHRRTHEGSGKDKSRSRFESFTRDFTNSSFKDITRRSSKSATDATNHKNVNNTEKTDDLTAEQRDPTSQEDLTRSSSRRGSRPNDDVAEDMTSAFILPDLTMHGVNLAGHTANGKDSAQRVLDHAVRHERGNCTVCKKDSPCDSAKDQTVNIPQPHPVSERPADQVDENTTQNLNTDVDEHDHTMRPSQPPSMALAKVLKSLEDELAHLKMQLAACQSQYSRHDAAVGRRKRVKLGEQMKVLMAEIENKSEVVYALYDVLEGQKDDAKEDARGKEKARQGQESGDEDDEELPWEGFESTQDDFTGRSGMSRKVLNV